MDKEEIDKLERTIMTRGWEYPDIGQTIIQFFNDIQERLKALEEKK